MTLHSYPEGQGNRPAFGGIKGRAPAAQNKQAALTRCLRYSGARLSEVPVFWSADYYSSFSCWRWSLLFCR
jgi:hypothetical protein